MDADEYERREEELAREFVVDDGGYGYADRGGEIWDYADDGAYDDKPKKRKKVSAEFLTKYQNAQDISNFIKPTSTITAAIKAKKTGADQPASKDIMDDLLEKLDGDDAELVDRTPMIDEGPAAFNMDE